MGEVVHIRAARISRSQCDFDDSSDTDLCWHLLRNANRVCLKALDLLIKGQISASLLRFDISWYENELLKRVEDINGTGSSL